MSVRFAHVVGGAVHLVVLNDDFVVTENIRLVGPSLPIGKPDAVILAGQGQIGCIALSIEGNLVSFLKATSLQNPDDGVFEIVGRYIGQEFRVI